MFRHNTMKHLIYLFLFVIVSCTGANKVASSDSNENDTTADIEDEYAVEDYGVYRNETFDKNVKTVWLHKKSWNMSNPAINKEENETLKISFDKLGPDLGDYYYTIIHCDAEWKKSDLMQTQYIQGFFQDFIQSFKFSFNTYEQYIHYELEIPNKNMSFKLTGNYILKVFRDNDPEDAVFTRRFQVYENKIITRPDVKRPSNIQERNYKQEVDFELNLQDVVINDIKRDLKVVIQQNNRWDNAIYGLQPLFIRGNQLIYDYNSMENVFDGGNEYRFLDTRNLRYRGQKVQQIYLQNRSTNVYLFPEEKRRFKNYLFFEDLDGKFIVKNQFAVNDALEADYVHVNFALNYPQALTDGEIYVFGGLTDNLFLEDFKMTYNVLAKQYEVDALIKQGYYDYVFMFKKPLEEKGDITMLEGDHFQTENSYTITTYLRNQLCDCDLIIGHSTFKSNTGN